MKIFRTEWRSGNGSVGIVLTRNEETGEFCAYMGAVDPVRGGINEEQDAEEIASYGARLTKEEAQPFFPDVDLSIYKNR